jgi:DNA polymerase III delta prime subunit
MIYISPLKSSIIYEQLKKISEIEDIKYEKNGLEMISNNCKGDLRLAINLLDAINNGFEEITCENIKKMYYQPDPKKILKLIQDCAARNLNKSIKAIDELKMEGYCGTDIFLAMINIVKEVAIDEDVRIKYISIISDFYTKVSDGLDTKLQLYGCVSKMILLE